MTVCANRHGTDDCLEVFIRNKLKTRRLLVKRRQNRLSIRDRRDGMCVCTISQPNGTRSNSTACFATTGQTDIYIL